MKSSAASSGAVTNATDKVLRICLMKCRKARMRPTTRLTLTDHNLSMDQTMTALAKDVTSMLAQKPEFPKPNPKDPENGPPATRRKFSGSWDEALYCYTKLLYWAYDQQDMQKSESFANRIVSLLGMESTDFLGIIGHEALALSYEVLGDGERAIEERETQIEKLKKYLKTKQETYTYDDLGDRYDLLAALYMDRGGVKDFDIALKLLKTSKKLAEKHGYKFDGNDLLASIFELRSKLKQK